MPTPTPVVPPTNAPGGPADDETTVLRPVPPGDAPEAGPDAEETAVLPQPPVPPGAADETAVLPPVGPDADETAVLPPVREDQAVRDDRGGEQRGGGPADRVPPGYFRDERSAPDGSDARTRELPQFEAEGGPRRRNRSDWAEETPLDDLPSLADELLGPREDDDIDEGRGRRGRRGR